MIIAYMNIDQSTGGKFALLQAMTRAMLLPLAAAILPRLSLIFFRYMQPFLIHRVSDFVAQPVTEYTINQGWGLTAAYGLVYIGIAVSSQFTCLYLEVWSRSILNMQKRFHSKQKVPFIDADQFSQAIYYHQTYRMITMTRGALVTTIYAKTIELSTT